MNRMVGVVGPVQPWCGYGGAAWPEQQLLHPVDLQPPFYPPSLEVMRSLTCYDYRRLVCYDAVVFWSCLGCFIVRCSCRLVG
jgi:hypothetical protein